MSEATYFANLELFQSLEGQEIRGLEIMATPDGVSFVRAQLERGNLDLIPSTTFGEWSVTPDSYIRKVTGSRIARIGRHLQTHSDVTMIEFFLEDSTMLWATWESSVDERLSLRYTPLDRVPLS